MWNNKNKTKTEKNIREFRNKTYLSLGLVQGVKVLAEGGDDALVAVGILAEDVLRNIEKPTHRPAKGEGGGGGV